MSSESVLNKVCLIAIDGWGVSESKEGNAAFTADTPTFDKFWKEGLHCRLDASGYSVGLPDGVMGNSEVGHLTMGAGRVQFQDLVRINKSVSENTLKDNETLQAMFSNAKSTSGRLHFLGLVSDGGVHSHISHLKSLVHAAKEAGVPNTYIHFFADGRDTPPTSGTNYVKDLQSFLKEEEYASLATVTGRYYAMDRDKRWERIKLAYEGLVGGVGEKTDVDNLVSSIEKRYEEGENDEFLKPLIIDQEGTIRDSDTLVFIDFRADRMRQISQTFADEPPFDSEISLPENLVVAQMTQYNASLPLPTLFAPSSMDNVLAEWLSKKGLQQYHTAETEKYAHVTFFFNGGRENAFENEDRGLVPSPKVATYDLQPEMNAAGVADSVIEALRKKHYDFVMCNFAPPDMVGHTGVMDAAVIACTATDKAIGRIYDACVEHGYVLVVTSDHGNCEEMLDEEGNPKTSHSTNDVPLFVQNIPSSSPSFVLEREYGGLSDVAPTILDLMGLEIPKEMTGKSMIKKAE